MSAARITVGPGDDLAALVRETHAESVLVLLAPTLDALSMARARASIGPLAVERAPGTRVNALIPSPDADAADVEAAARYLESAPSTTGQLLEVTARVRPQGPSRSSTNR